MAKRKKSTEENLWIPLFTNKERKIAERMAYNLEASIYDYYKYCQEAYTVFGVKSKAVPTEELEGNTISAVYNQYVKEAKKLKDHYGVHLEFLYEGGEDDL